MLLVRGMREGISGFSGGLDREWSEWTDRLFAVASLEFFPAATGAFLVSANFCSGRQQMAPFLALRTGAGGRVFRYPSRSDHGFLFAVSFLRSTSIA